MKGLHQFLFVLVVLIDESDGVSNDPELVVLMTDAGTDDQVGHIYKLNIHSWSLEIVYDVPDIRSPYAVDYDYLNKQVYWTDVVTKNIRRAGLDGTNPIYVANLSSQSSPEGLALDSESRMLFYTDLGNSVIGKININTLQSTIIVNTDIQQPAGITVDTKNKKIYWADRGSSPKIEGCDYYGQNRHVLVDTNLTLPSGVTVDEFSGRVFWSERNGSLNSVARDGTDRQKLGGAPGRQYVDISVYNGFVYFTLFNASKIFAVTEDGKHLFYITSVGLYHIVGIHVFSPNFKIRGPPCPNGFHGYDCTRCGNCGRISACEKTTGVCIGGCEPGFKARMCTEECDAGTFGHHCQLQCAYCKGGSVCDHETGECPYGCQDGWTGDNCTTPCPKFTYASPCVPCGHCAGSESCSISSGQCPLGCQPGWNGTLCDQACPPNTYGSCLPCGNCLSGQCSVITGQCTGGCQNGWAGPKCQIEVNRPQGQVLSQASTIGIGVGVAVILLLIIALVLFLVFRRRQPAEEPYVDFNTGKGDIGFDISNMKGLKL